MASRPKAKKKPKHLNARGRQWVVTFLQPRWYRPKPKLKIRPTLGFLLRTRFQAPVIKFTAESVKRYKLHNPLTKEGNLVLQVAIPWKQIAKIPSGSDPRKIAFSPWQRARFEQLVAEGKTQAGWTTN